MKALSFTKLLACLMLCMFVMLLAACRGGVTVKPDGDGGVTITPNEDSVGDNNGGNNNNNQGNGGSSNVEVHSHTYTLDSASGAYNCTDGGIKVWRCSCGETFNETVAATGHNLRTYEGRAATCDTDGYHAYEKCINGNCGYTTFEVIPALGHSLKYYSDVLPTCTTAGYTDKVECTRDGCTYAKETKVAALGHARQIVEGKAATCTQDGYYPYEICTRSGCTGDGLATKVVIDALGHDNVSYEGKAPSCTEFGWSAYTICKRCNYSTYSELPAKGHSYLNGYCACGHSDPGQHTHVWNDGEVLVEATCIESGSMKYTCTDSHCGDTKTVSTPALGHDNKHYDAKAATCTEAGWYEYDQCQRCGYSTKIVTPILGHSYNGGITTSHPTCTHTGVCTYTCIECGKGYTEEIPALGHDYVLSKIIEATCTENGEEIWVCRNDKTHEDHRFISKLGHDYSDWILEKQATCGEAGLEIRVCSHDSSHDEKRSINPTGDHKIDNSTGLCSVCNQRVKAQLPSPTINTVDNSILYWGMVDGAEAYEVTILQNDSKDIVNVVGTSIDLEPFYKNSNTLQIYVKSLASESSSYAHSPATEYIYTIPYGSIVNYKGLGYGYNLLTGTFTDSDNKSKLSIFNEIMFNRLNADQKLDIYSHKTEAFLSESMQTYTDFLSLALGTKFNLNGSVGVSKIAKVSAGYSFETNTKYEKKNYNETQAVFYDMYYEYRGFQTGFGGYLSTLFALDDARRNAELEALLSDTFVEHIEMLEAGTLSPEQFMDIYGSHIITEAVYGAKFSAHYEMITTKEIAENAFGADIKQGISAGIEATIKGVNVGLNSSNEQTFNTSFLATDETKDVKSKFSFDAIGGKNPANFTALSFADFGAVAKNWTDTMKSEADFAIIDVPDGSLYYVWDFLPDEYSKAKSLLMNYFFTQCDENYKALNEKVNEMYNDFYYFDIETGTLTFDISALQHANVNTNTSLDGVLYDDNGVVIFDGSNHVVTIYPLYNGNQVRKVVFKGGYQTQTLQGQTITGKFESISIKFDDDWTEDVIVEFENFAYVAPDGHAALDFSKTSIKNVTIISTGSNYLRGGNGTSTVDETKGQDPGEFNGLQGINGKNQKLTIIGSGDLKVEGGDGVDGSTTTEHRYYNSNGARVTQILSQHDGYDGGVGILCLSVTVNMEGCLDVVGGNGANAFNRSSGDNDGDGKNGKNGYAGGFGGNAIETETFKLDSGSVIATGGTGGKGGNASECNYAFGKEVTGGTGGAGGNGGLGISSFKIIINSASSTNSLTAIGGNGGNSGKRGGCHDNDHGDGWLDAGWGKDGANGVAGVGGFGISADCTVTDPYSIITTILGQDGQVITSLNQS